MLAASLSPPPNFFYFIFSFPPISLIYRHLQMFTFTLFIIFSYSVHMFYGLLCDYIRFVVLVDSQCSFHLHWFMAIILFVVHSGGVLDFLMVYGCILLVTGFVFMLWSLLYVLVVCYFVHGTPLCQQSLQVECFPVVDICRFVLL